ncbi:nucleotide-binding universal stress UspA family protein [Bradyrhizobium sp. USDA 3256]
MYRHILIPTDGSDLAEQGVKQGLALAKSLGAKVSVVFVVEPLSEIGGRYRDLLARFAEIRKEEATSALDRAAHAARGGRRSLRDKPGRERATPSSHHRSSRG